MEEEIKLHETFSNDPKGRKILYRSLVPTAPRAQVIFIHGFSEHSGVYLPIAKEFAANQIIVHMLDLPGHGLSGGRRSYVSSFQDFEEAVLGIFEDNSYFRNDLPIFLIGHSMGGLISGLFCQKFQTRIDGLILCSPLAGFNKLINFFVKPLSGFVSSKKPYFSLPCMLIPKRLCRDKNTWERYYKDPLRLSTITLKLFQLMLVNTEHLKMMASLIKLPVLIFQGVQDKVVSPEATRELFNEIGSRNKNIIFFTEAVHELFHEIEKKQMMEKILAWIDERIPNASIKFEEKKRLNSQEDDPYFIERD